MRIEVPDPVVDALRVALGPLIARLIDERVEQRRPLLLSISQVADELACSRGAVYSLIHNGHLEAIRSGRSYRVATAVLQAYVAELSKPTVERHVVSAARGPRAMPALRRREKQSTSAPSVEVASKPPRAPGQRRQRVPPRSVIADERWTVAQFAARWYGVEAANTLLSMAGIERRIENGEETFRYGDLLDWHDSHEDEFMEWLERFSGRAGR